jgi:hypothetical protein
MIDGRQAKGVVTIARALIFWASPRFRAKYGASGESCPSHGVFSVKLIRLGRPLACHPRSGAKRSEAGSEATLTRRRPDTLS